MANYNSKNRSNDDGLDGDFIKEEWQFKACSDEDSDDDDSEFSLQPRVNFVILDEEEEELEEDESIDEWDPDNEDDNGDDGELSVEEDNNEANED